MYGIKVKIKNEELHERERLPLVTLLLLLAGVFGIMLFLKSLNGIDYRTEIVLPVIAALCFVIWFSYSRYRKLFCALAITAFFVCGLTVVIEWNTLAVQFSHIKSSLSGEIDATASITLFALLFAVALSFVLFAAEYLIKNHTLLYILTTALLLLSPLLGIRANAETVFLLILFQAAFWTVQTAARRGQKAPFASARFRRSHKVGSYAVLALVIAFAVALPIVMSFSEQLFQLVYEAEGYVVRSVSNLTGKASEPITGGKISSGNNYRTGTVHLNITASSQPTETLYLRGFGGGEYIGGDWIRSSDEALFKNITEENDWQDWYDRIANLYYSMYFVMNENTITEEPGEPITLNVRHSNHKYENAYVPYYSQRNYGGWYSSTAYGENEGYQYSYFEQKDMNINWENIPEEFEERRDIYKQLQSEYIAQIQKSYTQVPTELLPRLTALVEENPLSELNDITAFILYTLHSNAKYSLTPGWSAFNQDISEYFLYERKEGFCEHFALTATLMYRLYGIPARYATGYAVSPSDFEQQDDGSLQAAVTDEAAHAWVEIFLENYGWTPVEVTPSSDGSVVVSYPGFDDSQLNKLLNENGWDIAVPSLSDEGIGDLPSTVKSEGSDFLFNFEMDWTKYRELFLILITCFCYTLLLMPLFLDHRRLCLLRGTEQMNCRELFYRFVEILHFGGILTEYNGSENDFALLLPKFLSVISSDEAKRLIAAVNEAAFGLSQPNEEETEFIRTLVSRAASNIYNGLSRYQKIVFKYIKAFI